LPGAILTDCLIIQNSRATNKSPMKHAAITRKNRIQPDGTQH